VKNARKQQLRDESTPLQRGRALCAAYQDKDHVTDWTRFLHAHGSLFLDLWEATEYYRGVFPYEVWDRMERILRRLDQA
jgi:hypothetical protein